jgi:hypothetical protein
MSPFSAFSASTMSLIFAKSSNCRYPWILVWMFASAGLARGHCAFRELASRRDHL